MNDFNVCFQFPTVISPKKENIQLPYFLDQLKESKEEFKNILLKSGALLFRGYPIHTAAHFADFIETLGLGNFINYIGGDSPRTKLDRMVYTSTEAPSHFHIPLHQELSYVKNFPHHIYFFCETEPKCGGATIIADARQVMRSIDSKIQYRFKEKGLKYISHYYSKSKLMQLVNKIQRAHKSWPEVFETNDKLEVEKKCIENEFGWQWLTNDWIEVNQQRPAIIPHPITQEILWFNQAHLYDFNPRLLGWKNYLAVKLLYLRKHTILHQVYFADGSKIPYHDLKHILDVLENKTVSFPWKKGDVLVLDNVLSMHGRAPFKGPRRILAAMTS